MCGSGAGSALLGVIQGYGDVCGRRERAALLRPFDDADAVRGEQVVQTRIFPFFGRGKAVKVEMMERERFQRIGFDDGVGLLTAPVCPSPRRMPRVNVVFPAPKSPCRWMTNGARSDFAQLPPSLSVDSSSGSRRERVAPSLMKSALSCSKDLNYAVFTGICKHKGG